MTLLYMLKERQRWSPVRFDLKAAYIENDKYRSGGLSKKKMIKELNAIGCELVIRKIGIKKDEKRRSTPCFWCSWNRRKALFDLAIGRGCNKLAMGHHKDDIAETILLNLLFNGEFSSVKPSQPMFDGKLVIIRPLAYVEEKEILAFARERGYDRNDGECEFSASTKRRMVKNLLNDLSKKHPDVKTNLFRSQGRIREDYICGESTL
jgi:tRNA 2-thiocytidine biosynthesis protein TtcA